MIEKVLQAKNLYKALRQVVKNKGSAGIDKMKVSELYDFVSQHKETIIKAILESSFVPSPIKGRAER